MEPMLSFLIPLFSTFAMAAWDMNDVALLLPLPRPGEEAQMLSPKTEGVQGPLLPAEIYQTLPWIVIGEDRLGMYENSLRVVAIRIDPCFQEGSGPQPCQRQIRFVWQPFKMKNGVLNTLDGAIHTFHTFNENEWRVFIGKMRSLKARFVSGLGAPLQIHPVLRAQGYNGPYWQELRRILLSHCGPQSLSRATAMVVNPMGTTWVFTGFDIKNGAAQRIPIARLGRPAQAVFVNLEDKKNFRLAMNPYPENEVPLLNFFNDSKAPRSESETLEVVRRAVLFENPRVFNPGNLDCASCHSSRAIPHWAAEKFPQWSGNLFAKERFVGPGNLRNLTPNPVRTNVIRAFGYFDRDPIISQRTVNEAAVSASLLN